MYYKAFLLTCCILFLKAGYSLPGQLRHKYKVSTAFRHPQKETFIFRSNKRFVLIMKNFKGTWKTTGKYTVKNDTLIVHMTSRSSHTKSGHSSREMTAVNEVKKYIITSQGLVYPGQKTPSYFTPKAWKKRGKPIGPEF